MQITIYNTLKSRLETIDIEFTDRNSTCCGEDEDAPNICMLTELNGGLLIRRFDYTYPVWQNISKEQWLQGLPPPESQDQGMRLCQLESMIATYRKNFYRIGKALKEIRDQRLYRQLCFDSFEQYTQQRWDMRKCHAYRLIDGFYRNGTYTRKVPVGTKIARWYCPCGHCTFSLLPDCLSLRLSGSLIEVENTLVGVENSPTQQKAADTIRTDIDLAGALRWIRQRRSCVKAALILLIEFFPELFAGCPPLISNFRATLEVEYVLPKLCDLAEPHLYILPPPLGLSPQIPPKTRQHHTGSDPPLQTV